LERDPTREDPDRLDAREMLSRLRRELFGRGDPVSVGRFQLRELLGRGAHGSVYLAHDEQLQRTVAVKLLREESDPSARARLLREAQALARLKHPNVLTIHDVGIEGDRIFVAMEHVEAGTLKDWCAQHPAGTKARFLAVLDLAIATARGLAAAHEAGIVHRDIKPANILVGADGRPRIADFGVARSDTAMADTDARTQRGDRSGAPSDALTRTGMLVGTPAYMAPEQLAGRGDAASDQWSLCATLWEVAYGQRAYDAADLTALIEVVQGPPRPPPASRTEVPGWWRDILTRGLARDPEARWPSVAALAAALERGVVRRRRRIFASVGGALVLAGVATLAMWHLDREERRAQCRQGAEAIGEVWNDEAEAGLRDALLGTGVAYAQTSADRAVPYLHRHAEAWRTRYAELCAQTEVEGARDPGLWAASRGCLMERRGELAALLDVLVAETDANVVRRTVDAVAQLDGVDACADDAALVHRRPLEADDEADAALHRRLWRVRALEATGQYAQGHELARELVEAVVDHPSTRLRVKVGLAASKLAHRVGSLEASRDELGAVFDEALAAGELDLALDAATGLTYLVGRKMADHEVGFVWGRVATGLHAHLGGAEDLALAALQSNYGAVYQSQGRGEEAERAHTRALEIWKATFGDEHPRVAAGHLNRGNAYLLQGRYAEAAEEIQRSLAIEETALGPDHPALVSTHSNLGTVYVSQDRYDDGARECELARTLGERVLGPEHPDLIAPYVCEGNAHYGLGEDEEAERAARRALAIVSAHFDEDHPDAVGTRANLAAALLRQHRFAEAEEIFRECLAITERTRGPEHRKAADVHHNLAAVYQNQERYEDAERELVRAIEIYEKAGLGEHPNTALSHYNLGIARRGRDAHAEAEPAFERVVAITENVDFDSPLLPGALELLAATRLDLGRAGEAVADAERALAIHTKASADPIAIADVRFVLARAMWASPTPDRARARTLAEEARDAYREGGAPHAETLATVEDWLDRHRVD
jgi:tetratricopeptide (TPR) repeat protein/tRNA A-37 threonylcarbamoyl transferase component Bud32